LVTKQYILAKPEAKLNNKNVADGKLRKLIQSTTLDLGLLVDAFFQKTVLSRMRRGNSSALSH
jgi:hypothetical protein